MYATPAWLDILLDVQASCTGSDVAILHARATGAPKYAVVPVEPVATLADRIANEIGPCGFALGLHAGLEVAAVTADGVEQGVEVEYVETGNDPREEGDL